MKEELRLGELGGAVIDAAAQDLADYSVGFVGFENTPRGLNAVLLGSGTLVSVGSIRAVLTAHHVVSILPTEGRLGLILGPSLQQHAADVQGLTYLKIASGANAADGPDLGAIIFAPSIAGAIAARKTFYNLELRRDQMLSAPLDLHDGFWFVHGFIDEKTVEERGRNGYERIKCFYNLSGAGGPDKAVVVGEHDYFAFPIDYGGRSIAPKSFGGMSGGGLWQVPFTRDTDGQIKHQAPLLSGVVFYQEVATQISCNIKCHGRQSVYRVAYKAIDGNEP